MEIELVPSLRPVYEKLRKAARNELVYLTGPPSTGKTTLVKKLFQDYKGEYVHAYIDCYNASTQSKLLSIVCQEFYSTMNVRRSRAAVSGVRLPEPGEPVAMGDFPRYLSEFKTIAKERGFRRLYVVLDCVEVFEKTNMMDTFVALCRFNALGLRMIVISHRDPADLIHCASEKSQAIAMSIQDRYQAVLCPVWSKEDIVGWILAAPPRSDVGIYSKFVRNIVILVYESESKDPRQMRMYCQEHFEDFIKYYKSKKREHVLRMLKSDPEYNGSFELKEEELDEYDLGGNFNASLVANFLQDFKVRISKDRDNSKWTHKDSEIKIPMNTAVLIIAAYLAAYTRSSDDKLNFVSYQKGKRHARTRKSHDSQNRPFTMERLIQIYIRLVRKATGEKKLNVIYNNDHVLADIERLENLNILHHVSGSELSSDSRYKLSHCIKREYVDRLLKNQDLELEWFTGLPSTG